jgi:hypothetical protein
MVRRPRTFGARALSACALVLALGGGAASSAGTGAQASTATAAGTQARQAAAAVSTAPLGGVNLGGPDATPAEIDREMTAARALHAKVVRTEVAWSELQPLRADRFDAAVLATTDRLVADAAASGIRVIVLVDRTPCWASSAPAGLLRRCVPGRIGGASAWPPADPSGFAGLLAFLAQRYGSRLAALEVWNEPDQSNEYYFAGPHKPQRYARLLRAAYAAVKRVNPEVAVLGGSLVGSNGAFLRALYAAGIKGHYDGLAVHFYTLTLGSLRSIREVQLAHGDRTPLWLDEFGWSSCWPRRRTEQEQACVTAATQAENLADTLRSLVRAPYVAAAVVYKLQDSVDEEFGVLNVRGAHKRSFSALSHALAAPFGAPARLTLRLRRSRGRVVASGSGPVGDFMGLEAFVGGQLRYRATFTLDRFDRYAIALPGVLGTRGMSVRVFQYWAGPTAGATGTI